MLKTLSIAALFILVVSILASCTKCYSCTNSCSTCILLNDSTHAIIAQRKLCSDTLHYQSEKDSLTALGYSCTATAATYRDDFCVNNKKAIDQYLPYHEGDGAYTCNPK